MKEVTYYEFKDDRAVLYFMKSGVIRSSAIEWMPVTLADLRKTYKNHHFKPRFEKVEVVGSRSFSSYDNCPQVLEYDG